MSFQWVRIEDDLPPLGLWVLTHSREENWNPGTAYRLACAGGGWIWCDDNNTEFEGMQFWAYIPPLPMEIER